MQAAVSRLVGRRSAIKFREGEGEGGPSGEADRTRKMRKENNTDNNNNRRSNNNKRTSLQIEYFEKITLWGAEQETPEAFPARAAGQVDK